MTVANTQLGLSESTMQPISETEHSATTAWWEEYKSSGSATARDSLVAYYLPLVQRIAKRAARLVPQAVDVDDMTSAGYMGLLDAMDAYDPSRGIRFSTFCSYRIRGAILDELRAMDWVPRAVRQHTRQVDQATNRLRNKLSRKPTDDELSGELGVEGRMFKKMRGDASRVDVLSIDSTHPGSRDSSGSWSETIRDGHQTTPIGEALKGELKEVILRSLSKSEKLIVVLYYYEGMTMKEIGQTLNLSESRVSQVHASVLLRLRDRLTLKSAPGTSLSGYEEFFKAA